MVVRELLSVLEELAPIHLAADWDNVGLQIGSVESKVSGVLVALDVTPSLISEALQHGCNTLLVHHPLIFNPMKTITDADPVGRLVSSVCFKNLNLIVAHTNLDSAAGGVNDVLAGALGVGDCTALIPASSSSDYKMVVFTPTDSTEPVLAALSGLGCGVIGEYSSCSFRSPGTGTFIPSDEAEPVVGEKGALNQEAEERLEIRVPPAVLRDAVNTLVDVHPYEEVAYDIYRLENPLGDSTQGLGRVGALEDPMSLDDCLAKWSTELSVAAARVSGPLDRTVTKVAVCGGSASSVVDAAINSGADVLVGGEFSYHDYATADKADLSLVAFGHDVTERIAMGPLVVSLTEKLKDRGIEIRETAGPSSSWNWWTSGNRG